MYYDDYDLTELNINEMVSYEEFIGEKDSIKNNVIVKFK